MNQPKLDDRPLQPWQLANCETCDSEVPIFPVPTAWYVCKDIDRHGFGPHRGRWGVGSDSDPLPVKHVPNPIGLVYPWCVGLFRWASMTSQTRSMAFFISPYRRSRSGA